MLIGEYERDMKLLDSHQRRYKDENLLVWYTGHVVARVDVVHHDRKRGEIERYIVAQCAAGANPDPAVISLSDEIDIADVAVIRIRNLPVAGVQPVIENPRKILPVDYSEDQRLLGIECHRHNC